MDKTNVMRLLDQKKIVYTAHSYVDSAAIGGREVAEYLHEDPARVFKTLVAVASSKKHYVFMVPVCAELNLKKAARAVGEKKIEMLKAKELLPLTGYVHGGCSPIGMKKQFLTTIDSTAQDSETIFFSAGKIGYHVELPVVDLQIIIPVRFADIADFQH